MKLKYYLRGLGMGILFATVVMMVAGAFHRGGLTDDQIIKEAQKLGMVMKDSEDKNGLWGPKDETESENSEDSPADNQKPSENETPSDSQKPSESETASDSQIPSDTQNSENTQQPSENQTQSEAPEYVTIKINKNDTATSICEKLYTAGVIDNSEDFHNYLKEKAYTKVIRGGTFEVPKGATFEEICEIIIRPEHLENN